MFFDLFETNIAYIFNSDPFKIYAIDIGGRYSNGYVGHPNKESKHKEPMARFNEFQIDLSTFEEYSED